MKLLSLSVENFAGLPDRTFSFATRSGGAARAVLVVGGPAAGKSSLLAAIIAAKEHIAPYGKRPSLASRARQPGREVVIQTTWELDEEERASTGARSSRLEATVRGGTSDEPTVHHGALVGVLKGYSHLPSVGKVELFAEHRALGAPPLRPARSLTETEERLLRLADDPFKYRGVWAYLRGHAIGGASAPVAPLLEALEMLGCPISGIGLDGEAVFFEDSQGHRLSDVPAKNWAIRC